MSAEIIFNILFWGIFVGGGSVFVLFCFYMAIRQYRKDKAQKNTPRSVRHDAAYVRQEIQATVADLSCHVETSGTKAPETRTVFSVSFQTESGNILKYNVPEEMYEGFEIGLTGTLTLSDDALYSFVPTANP